MTNECTGCKDSDHRSEDSDQQGCERVLVARRFFLDDGGDPRFDPDQPLVYHDRYRGTTPVCHLEGAYVRVPRKLLPERATRCERCDGTHAQLMGLDEDGRTLLDMDPGDLPAGGDES